MIDYSKERDLHRLAGEAVRKCSSGESIPDEELKAGIEVLHYVIPALRAMGERYYLAYSTLQSSLGLLERFQCSREEE